MKSTTVIITSVILTIAIIVAASTINAMAQTNLDNKFKQCYVSAVPIVIRQGLSAIKDHKFMVNVEKDAINNMTKPVPFKPIAGLDSATNLMIYQESVKTIKSIADCMRMMK